MMQLHPVRSWLPFACGEPAMLQCTDLPMLLPQLLPRPMQLRKRSGSLSRCACHSLQPTARMKEYPRSDARGVRCYFMSYFGQRCRHGSW